MIITIVVIAINNLKRYVVNNLLHISRLLTFGYQIVVPARIIIKDKYEWNKQLYSKELLDRGNF